MSHEAPGTKRAELDQKARLHIKGLRDNEGGPRDADLSPDELRARVQAELEHDRLLHAAITELQDEPNYLDGEGASEYVENTTEDELPY